MTRAPGRLIRRLLGIRSPSEWVPLGGGEFARWADIGTAVAEGWRLGIERAGARRAELLASGMAPEEAQAVMHREMVEDPGFAAMLEYSRGVAMRSFGSLCEDEEGDDGQPAD